MSSSQAAAMEWFKSFYVTKAMFDKGYKVYRPIYDFAVRQGVRPIKYGEEYSLAKEQAKYDVELASFKEGLAETSEEEKADYIESYTPAAPLSPWTWSFKNGPLYEYEKMEQIDKFDTTTLTKIVAARTDPIPASGIPRERALLLKLVEKIVYDEYDTAEMALECHTVLELVSGVLCLENWKWLSKSDRDKFEDAHRAYSIENVLEKQVEMIKEMIAAHNTTEECRGYNRARAILQDNKKTLGLPIDRDDEPDSYKRKEMDKNEENNEENDDQDTTSHLAKRHKVKADCIPNALLIMNTFAK